MPNKETKTVIIDLNNSKSANKFNNDQLMHRPALDQIKSLIQERIENEQNIDKKDRIHETISILGSRGSGKSSLLLSVGNAISDEIMKDVARLRPIDPTLFESRQNILITLIALIQEAVNEVSDCKKIDDEKHNGWLRSLRKLAEGLSSLDGVGKKSLETDIWSDPQIILEKGLNQALSEEQLESNFYTFIDKSLELLNKKFLLILFDDIDTSFEKGKEVLETLRKYLRYPKIITMIAGDMDLFIKLVRKQNWDQFETLHKNEDYTKEEIKKTIDHLEEQYLLKVLPSSSRIELYTLYDLLAQKWEFQFEASGSSYEINTNYDSSNNLLTQLDKKYFQTTRVNSLDPKYFRKAFLTLPMRTIIQFVRVYSKESDNSLLFLTKVVSLFSSLFANYRIPNTDQLLDKEKFISSLAIILINNNKTIDIAESYRLKPIFSDNENNTLMLILNMLTNHHLSQQKSNVFSYFIKVGLSRETLLSWPVEKTATTDDYIRHVGLHEDELPIKMVRRYCGFIDKGKAMKPFHNGYMLTYMHKSRLSSLFTIKKENKDNKIARRVLMRTITGDLKVDDYSKLDRDEFNDQYKEYITKLGSDISRTLLYNTHESLSKRLGSLHEKFLVNLLFMQVTGGPGQTNSFASIFPLIGFMSEILMFDEDDKNPLSSSINRHIRTHSQVRTFVGFNVNDISDKSNHDDEEDDESTTRTDDLINEEHEQENYKDLLLTLEMWVKGIKEIETSLPVHILAKIWTRFFYSLESIATDSKNIHLGAITSLQISQFLNSWITETLMYIKSDVNVRLKNVVTSIDNFEHNYKEFKIIMEEEDSPYLQFCDQVLNFPLWKYYLDEKTKSMFKIEKLDATIEFEINRKEKIKFDSLVPLLNTIVLQKIK